MKIGYARVSSVKQNLTLQIEALTAAGCQKVYREKVSAFKHRPEFENMINGLRNGDTLYVWKIDRIGRSLIDLFGILSRLKEIGVNLVAIKDNVDTSTMSGKVIFSIAALMAEYETELRRDRAMAGLEIARSQGRIGGRKPGLSPDAIKKANSAKALYLLHEEGRPLYAVTDICNTLGISKKTFYKYLKYMNVEIGTRDFKK
ncbi:MAG: recombinase family protein [Bacteroidales bacterium]|jgi:DNA invertase Pin-like site-specific DNA recombinase|nr:recombinase family protein [Bacteroidales bacterium]